MNQGRGRRLICGVEKNLGSGGRVVSDYEIGFHGQKRMVEVVIFCDKKLEYRKDGVVWGRRI